MAPTGDGFAVDPDALVRRGTELGTAGQAVAADGARIAVRASDAVAACGAGPLAAALERWADAVDGRTRHMAGVLRAADDALATAARTYRTDDGSAARRMGAVPLGAPVPIPGLDATPGPTVLVGRPR